MKLKGLEVKGAIDQETRCTHYHKPNDRIAINFYCCQQYFPCYQCHAEHGCGQPQVWPKDRFAEKATLCGSCGVELSITDYLHSGYSCPNCQAAFNPGCALHKHLYFAE